MVLLILVFAVTLSFQQCLCQIKDLGSWIQGNIFISPLDLKDDFHWPIISAAKWANEYETL